MLRRMTDRRRIRALCGLTGLAATLVSSATAAARVDGQLTIRVADEASQQPIPARIELRDARDRLVRVRPDGAVVLQDGIYFEGETTLELRRGSYTFLIEAGPEYRTRPGRFEIKRNADDATQVTLLRRVNMNEEGWWAGDLDVHLPLRDMPVVLKARGVDFAPVVAAVNTRGKCTTLKTSAAFSRSALQRPLFGPWALLDDRAGGGALLIGGDPPINLCGLAANEPSLDALRRARENGATVVALSPFAWDLPIWLAADQVDAIEIIHRHALRNGVVDDEGWGRPRDKSQFSGPTGNGRYSEQIYQHVLNSGLRIPLAAGSGAGVNSNPVGENRVYVHCGETMTRDSWLEGLRAGRVSVTNGPLLRATVEGEPPGHVFYLDRGESREFQIALKLTFYDQHAVDYLEIVKNGQVLHEIRLDELARSSGRLPPVPFDASGWFLVRAVTDKPGVYQYAATGPFYVESAYKKRISRGSAEFFLEWLDEAQQHFADHPAQVARIEAARPFWQELLQLANAE